MNKIIFYHTHLEGEYKLIIQDQLTKIFTSGLYKECTKIEMRISSNDETRFEWVENLVSNYTKINTSRIIIDRSYYPSNYREPKITLQHLKDMALKEDGYYCYIHTKAVTNRGFSMDNWRLSMDYAVIINWRNCIKELENDADAVGPNLRKDTHIGYFPHFSGTYWWTSSSYIKTLNHDYIYDKNEILLEEFWIGSNINCNLKSVFECGHNEPYLIDATIDKYIKDSDYLDDVKVIPYLPINRFKPELIENKDSAWGNIPTIIRDIIDRFNIKTNNAVEFGVEFGYSTSALSNYFDSIDGVDIFTGDEHAGFKGDIFDITKSNLANFDGIKLHKMPYQEFTKDNNDRYDFAHVDIIHTYEDTYACGEWCVKHCDVVIFHDTISFKEVYQACYDLAFNYNMHFYNYEESNGLGILVKK